MEILRTNDRHERARIMKLNPVIPFEPILTDKVPRGDNWISQIKWDGVRMLAYYDGTETRLVNRRLNDRTQQYPEFLLPNQYCAASSFILDGEFVAFDEKKPSFHEIMKRDRLRKKQSIESAITQVPVTYMIFDILFLNGNWVTSEILRKRQALLNQVIKPTDNVQIVQSFSDADALFDVMRAHNMEGIVTKNMDSSYSINGKDSRWQKRKLTKDLYAAIGGVTYRGGTINALLLGVFSHDSFIYIGHSGTGKLTNAQWKELTRKVEPFIVPCSPFVNIPDRHEEAIWVKPQIVVKVQFFEWTPANTMRHSSIQSVIDDIPLTECTMYQMNY
ncbi:DNA ligase [Cohnella sp. GCM10020058]|uniref:ATP-dependent DNA ligase n=1 Tax=Cohnella sp. GCM10020058 TaxID=3317330 RepID=UPI003628F60C